MPTIVYLDTLPAQNGLDILHSQSKVDILKINSYENEYSLFFTSLIANKHINLIHHQDKFWKIYEYIQNQKNKTDLINQKY